MTPKSVFGLVPKFHKQKTSSYRSTFLHKFPSLLSSILFDPTFICVLLPVQLIILLIFLAQFSTKIFIHIPFTVSFNLLHFSFLLLVVLFTISFHLHYSSIFLSLSFSYLFSLRDLWSDYGKKNHKILLFEVKSHEY